MKKSMTRKALSLMLVVMMLVSACITYTASAANLTITIGDGTTTQDYGTVASLSALTDGATSGNHTTDTIRRSGSSGVTEYVLSFDSAETFDTIKVYFSCPTGPSWKFPGAEKYAVTVDGAAAEVTFSSDETNEINPVAILKLAAPVTTTSAAVTIGNASYGNAVFEIAVENSANVVIPDDSSEAESSEDTSADDPAVEDPFGGKCFILASHDGKNVMINEDDQVRSFSLDNEPEDPNTVVWKFELKEGGYYKITNLGTGRILDVVDGADYNGVVVKTWESNDSAAQRFGLAYQSVDAGEEFANAYVATLFPKCSTTRAVDIAEESGYLQLWEYTSGNTNQMFLMLEVPEDYFDDTSDDDSTADDSSADDSSADDSSADDVSGEVSGDDTSDDTSTVTEINYAEGKKYTFESTKGFLAGYEDSGKLLTDGTVTNSEVKGQNVAIAGSQSVTDVVIDLGAKRTDIDKIVFGGVRIAGNRQFAQVTIEVSNNGKSFTKIDPSMYTRIDNETGAGSYDVVFDLAEFATARYVKISMISDDYVLSMSEIKVIGYGAEGGDVDPGENENPGDAGIVTISIVALIALAGAVVVSKRRFN